MEEMMEPTKRPEPKDDATKAELISLPDEDINRWGRVLDGLQAEVAETEYFTWFAGGALSPLSYKDNVLTLEVPNRSFAEIMEGKFGDVLFNLVQLEWGPETKLQYSIRK